MHVHLTLEADLAVVVPTHAARTARGCGDALARPKWRGYNNRAGCTSTMYLERLQLERLRGCRWRGRPGSALLLAASIESRVLRSVASVRPPCARAHTRAAVGTHEVVGMKRIVMARRPVSEPASSHLSPMSLVVWPGEHC